MNLGGNMSGVPALARGRGGQGMGLHGDKWRLGFISFRAIFSIVIYRSDYLCLKDRENDSGK